MFKDLNTRIPKRIEQEKEKVSADQKRIWIPYLI